MVETKMSNNEGGDTPQLEAGRVRLMSELAQQKEEKQEYLAEKTLETAVGTSEAVKLLVTRRSFWAAVAGSWVGLATIGRIMSGRWFFQGNNEARRLSDENNRLDNEVNLLRQKLGWRNESILVYRGVLEDRPQMLERAKRDHPYRSEPWEFAQWNNPNSIVRSMFKCEAHGCLEWVTNQPDWQSRLNQHNCSKLLKAKKRHANLPANDGVAGL